MVVRVEKGTFEALKHERVNRSIVLEEEARGYRSRIKGEEKTGGDESTRLQ